jgi:hypothetical protein
VAALVVLALVVGIVAVNGGGSSGSSSTSSGSVAQSTDDGATPAQGFSGPGATKGGETPESEKTTVRERFRDELGRFATVVLARARQVTGAVQRFAVLRIFKGSAPKVVDLVVNDQPTDIGRLHLLMLEPTTPPETQDESPWPLTQSPVPETQLPATVSPAPATGSPAPETASPEPIPSLASTGDLGRELAVAYTYEGQPTVVRELPAGVDAASVDIDLP